MWRVSEKERQRRCFRCQNNDSCTPLFIYRKHNVPSSLLLAAENRPTADCRKTLGCWPLISLIVSSSIFNCSVVLHFKRSADLWSQLTREGLILETEAKNALGTLMGDFAALWKLCELPWMWIVGHNDSFSWECAAVPSAAQGDVYRGHVGSSEHHSQGCVGTMAGLLPASRWHFNRPSLLSAVLSVFVSWFWPALFTE